MTARGRSGAAAPTPRSSSDVMPRDSQAAQKPRWASAGPPCPMKVLPSARTELENRSKIDHPERDFLSKGPDARRRPAVRVDPHARRSSHSALASWLRPSARTAAYVERAAEGAN